MPLSSLGLQFIIFIAIFFTLYSVQYLVVLTFVCYRNPYIMLLALRCRCRFLGTAGHACALICALFSF